MNTKERIVEVLKSGETLSAQEIAQRIGRARTTVYDYITPLHMAGIIQKEKTIYGRGRPFVKYHLSEKDN